MRRYVSASQAKESTHGRVHTEESINCYHYCYYYYDYDYDYDYCYSIGKSWWCLTY